MDRILAVIPVHNRRETTLAILENLRSQTASNFLLDIAIIDDGSTDGTSEAVASQHPDVTIVHGDGNLWWGGALNVGFRHGLAHGYNYIYTLNDDIVLRTETLEELHKAASTQNNTVCCSICLNSDDVVLSAGFKYSGILRNPKVAYKNVPYKDIQQDRLLSDTISTRSTLMPISVLQQNLFVDDVNFPHNYSDFEYFDRVRKNGFNLAVIRNSIIYSTESSSNYHILIIEKSVIEMLDSFMNIKYAHNLQTQWNLACNNTNFVLGLFRFAGLMTPYVTWLFFKVLLPKSVLIQLLVFFGRIPAQNNTSI